MPDPTQHPISQLFGLVSATDDRPAGRSRMEFEAAPHMCHSGGIVQGGMVTGWLDMAIARAVIAASEPGIVPLSLELKVSFFAPVRPGRVIAEAWVEKLGRKTAFAESRLLDAAGTVLAKCSSTVQIARRDKVEAASRAALG